VAAPVAPPVAAHEPVAPPSQPVVDAAPPPPAEDEPFDLTLDLSEAPAPAPSPGMPRFGRAGVTPEPTERPAPGGSTLFERMASLSRGSRPADEEPADEDGKALNIPRFLGRQNNQ
jgi:cell division protein FtsZ